LLYGNKTREWVMEKIEEPSQTFGGGEESEAAKFGTREKNNCLLKTGGGDGEEGEGRSKLSQCG
jgi:hypothetical protein